MRNGYGTVHRLKLNKFEMRIVIAALNAKRLKEKESGTDDTATSNLILRLIDVIES